jgi:oligopeptide transport system substrate-binding protein
MTPLILRLLILLASAILVSACEHSVTGYEPGTLRINVGSEPSTLDWSLANDGTSIEIVANMMLGLTQYRPDLSCAPACAKSWEILDGGRRYLFHLRSDAMWSDGKPVTASDFVFAWRRLLAPQTASQYAYFLYDIVNGSEYNLGKIKDATAIGVRAIDPQTLEVLLSKPKAYFLYLTAFCPTYPQRQDVVEKWGNHWTDPGHLVTNGAFILSKWEHEYKIELVANPRFVEGEPALHKLKLFMIPEQATAFALYENNQLDYIDNRSFSTSDVERCSTSPEYHNSPLLRNNYLGFNVNKPPFDDVRVRRAVSMSIDRNIFPRILRRGENPSTTWIPPALAGYSPQSATCFNPVQARKLLAEAGYGSSKKFPTIELLYPNREDTRLVVEAIQDQLKHNLNMNVDLVNQEFRVYLETLHRDAPPMYRASWGADYPDPETFMNLFTSHNGNNNTGWSNVRYDQLISQASCQQDPKTRANLYASADRVLCKIEAPIVPTYLSTQNSMVKPWVHGIVFNPLDLQFYQHVTVGD